MKVVCISDTHNRHWDINVPDGDLLLHAGDFTGRGTMPEVLAFNKWLGTMPHKHKVVIAGNHDFGFEKDPSLFRSLITNATYIENEEVVIEGLKIWGSPVSPWFFNWAFNVERGEAIRAVWERIPQDTDILLTHGPAYGVLDRTERGEESVGCEELKLAIEARNIRLHVFGHIHESAGIHGPRKLQEDGSILAEDPRYTVSVNASQLGLNYQPNKYQWVIEL